MFEPKAFQEMIFLSLNNYSHLIIDVTDDRGYKHQPFLVVTKHCLMRLNSNDFMQVMSDHCQINI